MDCTTLDMDMGKHVRCDWLFFVHAPLVGLLFYAACTCYLTMFSCIVCVRRTVMPSAEDRAHKQLPS